MKSDNLIQKEEDKAVEQDDIILQTKNDLNNTNNHKKMKKFSFAMNEQLISISSYLNIIALAGNDGCIRIYPIHLSSGIIHYIYPSLLRAEDEYYQQNIIKNNKKKLISINDNNNSLYSFIPYFYIEPGIQFDNKVANTMFNTYEITSCLLIDQTNLLLVAIDIARLEVYYILKPYCYIRLFIFYNSINKNSYVKDKRSSFIILKVINNILITVDESNCIKTWDITNLLNIAKEIFQYETQVINNIHHHSIK